MAEDDPLLGHGRQIIVREDWLRLTEEPILEPGLPIVDPHHHLWERDGGHPTCCRELLADTAAATTSARPSSCSAARCIAPRGRRRRSRWARPSS